MYVSKIFIKESNQPARDQRLELRDLRRSEVGDQKIRGKKIGDQRSRSGFRDQNLGSDGIYDLIKPFKNEGI